MNCVELVVYSTPHVDLSCMWVCLHHSIYVAGGLSLFLCPVGPLMLTDHILMPLRIASNTKWLNCRYCFQSYCMQEQEGWAWLGTLFCSWAKMVLSCWATDIKGHRCKSYPLCLWLSFQTLWKQEGVSVYVSLRVHVYTQLHMFLRLYFYRSICHVCFWKR